jgi:pyruvate dehydrogenase E2 component (dihydrolipoamide acetyltransferase)
MATELRMPDMGTVQGDVLLVKWLKNEGDTIALGDPLFEAETDKGISEVEAALAGVLLKKLVPDGGKAGAGEAIALIRRPGEADEPLPASRSASAPAASAAAVAPVPGSQHRAVPPVLRALARRRGVDIAALRGTGPDGRLTRQDVLGAPQGVAGAPQGVAAPGPAAPAGAAASATSRAVQGTAAQAAVARTVSQSWREKPVFHVHAQVDMTAAKALRAAAAPGAALSWDALLVKAAAVALAGEPLFRRYYRGDELREYSAVDVAVAFGVDDDLMVAAVRSPAALGPAAIAARIEELSRRAQARTLGPQDAEGSCFLVSNLGMFAIESFDAIIFPEHSAALAAGPAVPTPVSDGTKTWIAPLARLTLTVDHRVINGRTAARFLARLKQVLETGALS